MVRAALRESGITYVDFNTGHYEGDTYLDILKPYIRRIKAELGLLVGVQTPPHRDLSQYDELREMGVNSSPSASRSSTRRASIGCAPNVHVSLVALPEECASLSPRRYRWEKLKLPMMKRVVRRRLPRKMARCAAPEQIAA